MEIGEECSKIGLYPRFFTYPQVQIQECGTVGLYPPGVVNQLTRY
jgi:hypothetical protein